jgi:hypothetical protein
VLFHTGRIHERSTQVTWGSQFCMASQISTLRWHLRVTSPPEGGNRASYENTCYITKFVNRSAPGNRCQNLEDASVGNNSCSVPVDQALNRASKNEYNQRCPRTQSTDQAMNRLKWIITGCTHACTRWNWSNSVLARSSPVPPRRDKSSGHHLCSP